MSRVRILLVALGAFVLAGCGATPPLELPLPGDARVVDVITAVRGDSVPFERSPTDRYALVLRGQEFQAPEHAYRISTADDVRREGTKIEDRFVDGDVDQLTRLLVSKGYSVYRAAMGECVPADVAKLLERIGIVSDDATQVFFAYSGEGDRHGLRTRMLAIGGGRKLVPPDATIVPEALVAKLAAIKGTKALLLNACESGVFAEAARREAAFRGVVIAACARGHATTPHEPTGTSAIYASFFALYRDDPKTVRNLATVLIERAGDAWTNFRHELSDLWSGGLPISYEPVVYSNRDFLF